MFYENWRQFELFVFTAWWKADCWKDDKSHFWDKAIGFWILMKERMLFYCNRIEWFSSLVVVSSFVGGRVFFRILLFLNLFWLEFSDKRDLCFSQVFADAQWFQTPQNTFTHHFNQRMCFKSHHAFPPKS